MTLEKICLLVVLGAIAVIAVIVCIGTWHGLRKLKDVLYGHLAVPQRYTVMWFAFSILALVVWLWSKNDVSLFVMSGLIMTTQWQTRGYRNPNATRQGRRRATGIGGLRR